MQAQGKPHWQSRLSCGQTTGPQGVLTPTMSESESEPATANFTKVISSARRSTCKPVVYLSSTKLKDRSGLNFRTFRYAEMRIYSDPEGDEFTACADSGCSISLIDMKGLKHWWPET